MLFIDTMYILLGLLWLGFKIIHGKIIQCPVGGLTDDNQCNKLIQESVLQKFFINGYEKLKENKDEKFDIPYFGFKNTLIDSDVSKPKLNFKNIKRVLYKSKDELYHYEIFRKSLILNDSLSIEKLWNDALDKGTDTYIIKFHNKLVHQYIKKMSSNEEYMVLLQSFYKASSTYYFYKNYDFAYHVIDDGLEFFESVKEQLYNPSNDEQQRKHASVWYMLLLTLKIDIMNCKNAPDNKKKEEAITKLLTEEKQFDSLNYGSFPSSAVLLFRRYFLDNSIDTKNKLQTWLTNKKLWKSLDDDILYRKHISMYKFLIFFSKNNDKLTNIFKAIERPVLSTEDRLLNYQATKLALDTFGSCIDPKDIISYMEICSEFRQYQRSNKDLKLIMIPKLLILHYLRNKQNEKLIEKLYTELMIEYYIIEQDVLHLIVTAALDIDINSEKYQSNINNVKLAIQLLKAYVKGQHNNVNDKNDDNQEKIKTKKTITIIEEIDEIKSEEENEEIEKNEENKYTVNQLNELSNTKYTKKQKIINLFIAYKWLMELNEVLNNYSQSNEYYTTQLLKAENNANKLANDEKSLLGTEYLVKDEHFMYLKAKQKSKTILASDNWRATTMLGGWVKSMSNPNILKYTYLSKDKEQVIFDQLIYLKNNLKCPYINRIEILTILFKYARKLKRESAEIYEYIQSAISEMVVTPEDRLRNFEAHELFTMYLMERNEIAIKMANKLVPSKI